MQRWCPLAGREYSAMCPPERSGQPAVTLADRARAGRAMQGSSISAVRIERTAHPVPSGDVSAGQRGCVVRDRIELSTFRFSGQPRQALCGPAKTDVTDERNRARRKMQTHASRTRHTPSARQDSDPTQDHRERRWSDHGRHPVGARLWHVRSVPAPRATRRIPASKRVSGERRQINPVVSETALT